MANRKETGNRFDYLSSSLLQANEDAGLLLGQIDAYGTLIEQM